MGIKNFVVLLVLIGAMVSCETAPFIVRGDKDKSAQKEKKDLEEKGQESEEETNTQKPKYVEAFNKEKPFRPKIGLVLGPGLSHTFAHIGVIKQIIKEEIPIHVVIGTGWGSLVAQELSQQGSLHGLEWKASRSEELKGLSKLSFWRSEFSEKEVKDMKALAETLLTDFKSSQSSKTQFSCPIYSIRSKDVRFAKTKGFELCSAVPPLYNPGKDYAPYLMGSKPSYEMALNMGAEKVIYIDVLTKSTLWGGSEDYLSGASYWYWSMVLQKMKEDRSVYDKHITVKGISGGILDFEDIIKTVRAGETAGSQLVDFLQSEYQY